MIAVLRPLGFEIIEGIDLDKAGIEARVRRFAEEAVDARVALLFYAGDGKQVHGRNHFVLVDAKLDGPTSRRPMSTGCSFTWATTTALAVALLDAYRDNPLACRFTARVGAATRSLVAGPGLAAPSIAHVLIGFATSPGDVAQNRQGVKLALDRRPS